MPLSAAAVQNAYEIFKELGVKNIPVVPEDMFDWEEEKRAYPKTDTVYSFTKTSDGYLNLCFFTDNPPSPELLKKFDAIKSRVPCTSFSKMYSENKDLWIIGWS